MVGLFGFFVCVFFLFFRFFAVCFRFHCFFEQSPHFQHNWQNNSCKQQKKHCLLKLILLVRTDTYSVLTKEKQRFTWHWAAKEWKLWKAHTTYVLTHVRMKSEKWKSQRASVSNIFCCCWQINFSTFFLSITVIPIYVASTRLCLYVVILTNTNTHTYNECALVNGFRASQTAIR